MKHCPECNRNYADPTLNFCLEDGAELALRTSGDESPTAILCESGETSANRRGYSWESLRTSGSAGIAKSIAVLPFVNMSPDPENEYFCEGLAEELLNALSKLEQLKVASRTSAFSFKGKDTTIADIARLLHVESVLEGSVRKVGARVRVTVQLINARNDFHLWSEKYDRDLDDIFDVQEEITLSVVKALKVRLLGEERDAILKRSTDDIEMYELYLKGRFHSGKRTEEGLKKSVEYYKQAIEKNSRYALALAGLADAYCLLSIYGILPTTEGFGLAREYAEKALSMDDQLAEAHASLGPVKHDGDWDFAGAEREYEKALQLNPNYATAHQWYAEYLGSVGRIDEALSEIVKAKTLDPLSPVINSDYGKILSWADREQEAISAIEKALEISPGFMEGHFRLGQIFAKQQLYDLALGHFEEALKLEEVPAVIARIGHTFGKLGRRDKALESLSNLEALKQIRHVPSSCNALIYAGLGEVDRAFEWLERALHERDEVMIWLKVTPEFDSVKLDPRFEKLLLEVGFPE